LEESAQIPIFIHKNLENKNWI